MKYDLKAMEYKPDSGKRTAINGVWFLWLLTPEGEDYWRRVRNNGITPEAQAKLDAMKAQWDAENGDFIEVGGRYQSWVGEWECIAIVGDVAYCRLSDDDSAYRFKLDGSPLCLYGYGEHKLQRPKLKPMQVPWGVIEDKYNWAAMDEGGEVYVFPNRPSLGARGWSGWGWDMLVALKFPRGNMPWEQSLVERK